MSDEVAYLSVAQFAKRFGISPSTAERAIRSDDPPPFGRVLGRRLISIAAADEWFARQAAAGTAAPITKGRGRPSVAPAEGVAA